MSLEKVRKAVEDFLLCDTSEVLSIKGGWGVGKTYFWDSFIKLSSQNPKYQFQRYAYISLFGISSLDELKYAIFEQTINRSQIGAGISIDNLKQNAKDLAKRLGRKATWIINLFNFPWFKNIGSAIHSAAFLSIKDMLICLDDFERKGDRLSAKDVFGMVSLLKEQRNCKVVFIFNDSKLSKKAESEYKEFREKVIDVEVIFNPNANEAASLAFSNKSYIGNRISDFSIKLGINNIRILRKIERVTKGVDNLLHDFEADVLNQAFQTLTLLGWIYYSNNEKLYNYIKHRNEIMYVPKIPEEKKTLEQQKWEALLNDYGFSYYLDEFDIVLAKIIETGYVDEESLLAEAKKVNAQIIANKSRNSFSNAWRLFHDTFAQNEDELVESIKKALKENAEYIDANNLNGTVRLLRDLGKGDLASELIDTYIEKNKYQPEFFNLNNFPFFHDIDDKELISKFNLTYNETKEIETLEDVLRNISGKSGWGGSDEEVLKAASEEDFYKIFKSQEGRHLSSFVKTCLQIPASSENARKALLKIAQESILNRIRVKRYISLEENQADK